MPVSKKTSRRPNNGVIPHIDAATNTQKAIEKTMDGANPEHLDRIRGLGLIGATQSEVGAVFGVSESTVGYHLNRDPALKEAYETGLGQMRVSLRRKLFALATRNAAAAIFLAKNLLGMKDFPEAGAQNPAGMNAQDRAAAIESFHTRVAGLAARAQAPTADSDTPMGRPN